MEDSKLPCEMIMEIMSRASLKTLGIMCCTSKELNKLVHESCVLDPFNERNKIMSGFLIQIMRRGWMYIKEFAPSPKSHGLDLGFLPVNARILATSEQGIMVFKNPSPLNCRKDLYHVCKPATKQVLALPNPKRKSYSLKIAIVVMGSKPLHYKIIRFSDNNALKRKGKFYTAYRCDVFDSMTWEWRSLKPITLAGDVFLTNSQLITMSGSIYMLLSNNDILKFDAYSENWKVFSSPIPYDKSGFSRPSVELVKYCGRLGLACESTNANGCWEIWVLKTDELWEKEETAAESQSPRESLKALYGSDTSVMVNWDTLLFYRFKHGNYMISKVVLNDIPYQMFSFRSDFETVDLMHPHAESIIDFN